MSSPAKLPPDTTQDSNNALEATSSLGVAVHPEIPQTAPETIRLAPGVTLSSKLLEYSTAFTDVLRSTNPADLQDKSIDLLKSLAITKAIVERDLKVANPNINLPDLQVLFENEADSGEYVPERSNLKRHRSELKTESGTPSVDAEASEKPDITTELLSGSLGTGSALPPEDPAKRSKLDKATNQGLPMSPLTGAVVPNFESAGMIPSEGSREPRKGEMDVVQQNQDFPLPRGEPMDLSNDPGKQIQKRTDLARAQLSAALARAREEVEGKLRLKRQREETAEQERRRRMVDRAKQLQLRNNVGNARLKSQGQVFPPNNQGISRRSYVSQGTQRLNFSQAQPHRESVPVPLTWSANMLELFRPVLPKLYDEDDSIFSPNNPDPYVPCPNDKINFLEWTMGEFAQWVWEIMGGTGKDMLFTIYKKEHKGLMVQKFLDNPEEMKKLYGLKTSQLLKLQAYAARTVNRQKKRNYNRKMKEFNEKMAIFRLSDQY